jgi:hypothetical protein
MPVAVDTGPLVTGPGTAEAIRRRRPDVDISPVEIATHLVDAGCEARDEEE